VAAAPAKVNLVLEVLARRPDGYHELDTVLQTLELADDVTVTFGEAPGVTVTGPCAEGTPADVTNLAWRAAAALAASTGHAIDELHITLNKRIPPAGGLGGGASDAATVLRLLQRHWPGVDDGQVLDAANSVGSDEAFFLVGGTARARGRGERVEPLPDVPPHGVVLLIPRVTIERKTARMFAALDTTPPDPGGIASAWAAAPPECIDSASVFNAFERVAFDLFPGLAALWERAERRIGEPVRLAGAGPTLFWIGPRSRVRSVAEAVAGLGCTVIPTATRRRSP
jgi:4-diphosphocytidyl-2-C-methyl-D-erythritol kinase